MTVHRPHPSLHRRPIVTAPTYALLRRQTRLQQTAKSCQGSAVTRQHHLHGGSMGRSLAIAAKSTCGQLLLEGITARTGASLKSCTGLSGITPLPDLSPQQRDATATTTALTTALLRVPWPLACASSASRSVCMDGFGNAGGAVACTRLHADIAPCSTSAHATCLGHAAAKTQSIRSKLPCSPSHKARWPWRWHHWQSGPLRIPSNERGSSPAGRSHSPSQCRPQLP